MGVFPSCPFASVSICSQAHCFPGAALPLPSPAGPSILDAHIPLRRTKPATFTPHSSSSLLPRGKWSHNKSYTFCAHMKCKNPLHEINPKSHLKEQGFLDCPSTSWTLWTTRKRKRDGQNSTTPDRGHPSFENYCALLLIAAPLPAGASLVSFYFLNNYGMLRKKISQGASLVAQWLRICLPMQGTRVRALVWEDPTCRGAAGPVSHNC